MILISDSYTPNTLDERTMIVSIPGLGIQVYQGHTPRWTRYIR